MPSASRRRRRRPHDFDLPQHMDAANVDKRLRSFHRSQRHLRTHPAIAGVPVAPRPPPTASSGVTPSDSTAIDSPALVHAVFNNLYRKNLGVDPDDRTCVSAKIAAMQAVAPRPSLTDPSFVHEMASALPADPLRDAKAIARVAPRPLERATPSASARDVHRAIAALRHRRETESAADAADAAAQRPAAVATSAGTTGFPSTSPRVAAKRPRSPAKAPQQYVESDADNDENDDGTDGVARRTRAASKSPAQAIKRCAVGDPSAVGASDDVPVVAGKREMSPRVAQVGVKSVLGAPKDEAGTRDAVREISLSPRRTRSAAARAMMQPGERKGRSECCFCPDPGPFGGELKSELLGPFTIPRATNRTGLFVHYECACWAPQVYTDPKNGQLRRVYDEYCRGRQLRCSHCDSRGATIGCYVQKCKRVFHLRCLEAAGAHRVDRLFGAFCGKHAHLGKKRSYKILMEAATIADVAAAHRTGDSTFGLDAPHSRFTLLRRRETEVIFNKKLRVCSHPGVYENRKVVFSHKKRCAVGKNDRLRISDGIRMLRTSAIAVASGQLAYMAVKGLAEGDSSMSAVQARSAIASSDSTPLFLLRNLRKARDWTKDDITVVRPEQGKGPSKKKPHQSQNDGSAGDVNGTSGAVTETAEGESPGEDKGDDGKGTGPGKSVRLPSLKRSPQRDAKQNEPLQGEEEPNKMSHELLPPGNAARKDEGGTRECLQGKVKSAWETFLDDQLPKEREQRPDDSKADAVRNMARLWTLMTEKQRERYEQKAGALANLQPTEQIVSKRTEEAPKAPGVPGVKSPPGRTNRSANDMGLFNPARRSQDGVTGKRPRDPRSSPSQSLPGRGQLTRKRSRLGQPDVTASETMNWDEVFPDSLAANENGDVQPVRKAPQALSRASKGGKE